MNVLTLNECAFVTGGLLPANGASRANHTIPNGIHPNVKKPPGNAGGGNTYRYDGSGGGYINMGGGGYNEIYGSVDTIELVLDPSDASSVQTTAVSADAATLPSINVTSAPHTEPNSFEKFLDDVAGVAATAMCLKAEKSVFKCTVFGDGVREFLDANAWEKHDVHIDGAWKCAKLGDCYEYDKANGIKVTPQSW